MATLCLAKKSGEIEPYFPFSRSRFHQHFTRTFCAEILAQKITKLCFGFEIIWRQIIGKISECKMLMKLTPDLRL